MEEDDKHARRNLVTAAVTVIASWWLDVPLSEVVKKLFAESTATPAHFMAAAFAVLLFLSVRYSQSEDGQAYGTALNGARLDRQRLLMLRAAEAEARRFAQTGKPGRWFGEVLPTLNQQGFEAVTSRSEKAPLPAAIELTDRPISTLTSRVKLSFTWAPQWMWATEHDLTLKPGTLRRWLATRAYLKVMLYSPHGMRYMVPPVFCLAAEIVMGCRLFMLFRAS